MICDRPHVTRLGLTICTDRDSFAYLSKVVPLWSAGVTTFIVTFHYLGNDWFLRAKTWTEEFPRASRYSNEETARAALATARRYMRNKQSKARVVSTTLAMEQWFRPSADSSNWRQRPQYIDWSVDRPSEKVSCWLGGDATSGKAADVRIAE